MCHRIKAGVAKEGAHERVVLLLDKAIIVLLVGAAARQSDVWDGIVEVAHQVMVQEFAPVVGTRSVSKIGKSRRA